MGNSSSSTRPKLFRETRFAILPEELLIETLRYVSTVDLWNFCAAFKDIGHLMNKPALTRMINLEGWSDINGTSMLLNLNPENVTYLNVNNCDWLPLDDLRGFVGKCTNLDTLLVLGTKLTLNDQDIQCYNKTKITRLAVTIQSKSVARGAVLDRVTRLDLELDRDINKLDEYPPAKEFSSMFPAIKTVQLDSKIEHLDIYICVRWVHKWLESKSESSGLQLQLSIKLIICNLYLTYLGQDSNRTPLLSCFYCLEKTPEKGRSFRPCGRKVKKLERRGKHMLRTLRFEELNLCPPLEQHHKRYSHSMQKYKLMTRNAENLERLTICSCVLDNYQDEHTTPGSVLKKFRHLKSLQLFACTYSVELSRQLQEYKALANLPQLRYLSLQIPQNDDGGFLFDVLSKCSLLETLRIDNSLNSHLVNSSHIEALQYSSSLKELILEKYAFLCIDDVLSLLIQSKTMKLQRLSLSCFYGCRLEEVPKYLNKEAPRSGVFSVDLLSKYLTSNPQLTDCQFAITTLKDEQRDIISKQVSIFNRNVSIGC